MVGVKNNFSDFTRRILDGVTKAQEKSFQRLATGSRINSAADDAAGLAILGDLEAEFVKLEQGSRGGRDLISAAEIRDSAVSVVQDLQTRRAELAQQASNGTLSDAQRQSLNQEFQALGSEISRITGTTNFNGIDLFGSEDITGQVGTDSSEDSQITLQAFDLSSLNTTSSIGTQQDAQAALEEIQTEQEEISSLRASDGAALNRIQVAIQNNEAAAENVAAAASRIRDVDIASETANNAALNIRAQAGTALQAQANQTSALVLNLLK